MEKASRTTTTHPNASLLRHLRRGLCAPTHPPAAWLAEVRLQGLARRLCGEAGEGYEAYAGSSSIKTVGYRGVYEVRSTWPT